MRPFIAMALFIVCLPASAQDEKPLKFDWSLLPAGGDKDFKEKMKAVREKYVGKMVQVDGGIWVQTGGSGREVTAELQQFVNRGGADGVKLRIKVYANFKDKGQSYFKGLANGKTIVSVKGVVSASPRVTGIQLDDAEVIRPKVK